MIEWRVLKHANHISHGAHVPAGYIMIKQCVFKYPIHYGHISGIPLAEVLIEKYCILKGCFHTYRTCGDPASDVLIKGGGIVKHKLNVVTLEVFQIFMSPLNALADSNMLDISVTLDVFQLLRF